MFVELSFLIKVLASNSSKDEIHRDQWKKLRFDEQGLEKPVESVARCFTQTINYRSNRSD